ncbi:MAG: hypothetical protein HPY90_12795 [Syntrophothermus sp.]|uniref:hypothetical protein n=1 Tax=Syntrophothermus sp. TaxID=2736299 RepID=UPI00257B2DD8|nr:hypothetical protein [Syntrophothermus sp.]NSW84127.1 hypothetical protein [Syntrophothermus sp.]
MLTGNKSYRGILHAKSDLTYVQNNGYIINGHMPITIPGREAQTYAVVGLRQKVWFWPWLGSEMDVLRNRPARLGTFWLSWLGSASIPAMAMG